MKLDSIILESSNFDINRVKGSNTFDELIRDCSDYIKSNAASSKKPIFRGTNRMVSLVEKRLIRKDRTPSAMDEESTELFNRLVNIKFGVKNIRTSSIFATSNERLAHDFGAPYWVFPTNRSTYVIAPTSDSISFENGTIISRISRKIMDSMIKDIERNFMDRVNASRMQISPSLLQAIRKSANHNIKEAYPDSYLGWLWFELWIGLHDWDVDFDIYVNLNQEDEDYYFTIKEELDKLMEKAIDDVVKENKPKVMEELANVMLKGYVATRNPSDLKPAISRGHEIMIQAPHYYLVNQDRMNVRFDEFIEFLRS